MELCVDEPTMPTSNRPKDIDIKNNAMGDLNVLEQHCCSATLQPPLLELNLFYYLADTSRNCKKNIEHLKVCLPFLFAFIA